MLAIIGIFVLLYPIVMSTLWIVGSLFNKFNTFLLKQPQTDDIHYPHLSILLPCFNEAATIEQTVKSIAEIDYPDFELVMIDDCSTDDTLLKMMDLQEKYTHFPIHIIKKKQNGGKARGLNDAIQTVDSEFLLVMDSDSSVERQAVKRLVQHLMRHPKAGAVTGAPIIRNRTSLLGKLQTLEYVGIIGNIKQAQNFYLSKIMTISGVLVCYRKKALQDIHYFNPSAMTEDIDATWRLYTKNWDVAYEPDAHCYILAPETTRGLLKQRTRWALGGLEVFLNYIKRLHYLGTPERFLMLEMTLSNSWAIGMAVCMVISSVKVLTLGHFDLSGTVLSFYMIVSLFQFMIGYSNDRSYAYLTLADKCLSPIYIFIYWIVNMITALAAMIKMLTHQTGDGKWASSDRGL